MTTVDELVIKVTAQIEDLERGLDRAKADIRSLERESVASTKNMQHATDEMGAANERTLASMQKSWRKLRSDWTDIVSVIGTISVAVGVAMIAVDALGRAFANTAKTAKESLDEIIKKIDETTARIEEIQGGGRSYAQQQEIIKAKYAPGSLEYQQAMLNLQEKMATEAYTKFGSKEALGEISTIEAQRKTLRERPTTLSEQYAIAHGLPQGQFQEAVGGFKLDTFEYGLSPAYRRAAETGAWQARSERMNLEAVRQMYGTDWLSGEIVRKVPLPGAPGRTTAAPTFASSEELREIKNKLEELAREPKRIEIRIDQVVTDENVMGISSKVAEATAAGYDPSTWRTR